MYYLRSIAAAAVLLSAASYVIAQTRIAEHEFQPVALGMNVPVITSHNDLDRHLGHMIAIRGAISRTKSPTILGVDVRNPKDLDNVDAFAVGVLTRHEQSAEALANTGRKHGPIATRGPGVTYTLYFDLSGRLAAATLWPEPQDRE